MTAPTAAVLVIGDEILSGRTQDTNTGTIARWLGEIGVDVREARTVPDTEAAIVSAVNALRTAYTYLFTTGGIGPTHDDITADSIAAAFGTGISHHPEALAILEPRYRPGEFTEARRRMARIPHGAELIHNPVSGAPGFRIGNVFVLAGVPVVMQAMLEHCRPHIAGGERVQSTTISARVGEGLVAAALGAIQAQYPAVAIGSYPQFREGRFGASFVLRSREAEQLARAADAVRAMVRAAGEEPIEGEFR